MTVWEYAVFEWEGAKMGNVRRVRFSGTAPDWDKIPASGEAIVGVLGSLGEQGWELVSHTHTAGTTWNTWYLKRARTAPMPPAV